jgi:hypothetical protein
MAAPCTCVQHGKITMIGMGVQRLYLPRSGIVPVSYMCDLALPPCLKIGATRVCVLGGRGVWSGLSLHTREGC